MTRFCLAAMLGFVLCATSVGQAKPNSVGIDMVKVPAGSFMMGAPKARWL